MANLIVPQKLGSTSIPDFAGAAAMQENYLTPRLRSLAKAYEDRVSQIADIRSVTPEQVYAATQNPAAITASIGFQDPTQLMGMMPEEYMRMLGPKETPTQILNRNLDLLDKVTNMPERRKLLSDAASRNNSAMSQMFGNAAQVGSQSDLARNKDIGDIEEKRASLQLRADEANKNSYFQEEGLKIQKENLRIKKAQIETNTRYLKQIADAAKTGSASMPLDKNYDYIKRQELYTTTPEYFKKDDNGQPLGVDWDTVNKEAASAPSGGTSQLRNFAHGYLQLKANGRPFNETIPLGSLSNVFRGWQGVRLKPEGWFGVMVDKDGKISQMTKQPLVPFGSLGKSSTAGGAYSGVPSNPGFAAALEDY